jgi:hypothetical protein
MFLRLSVRWVDEEVGGGGGGGGGGGVGAAAGAAAAAAAAPRDPQRHFRAYIRGRSRVDGIPVVRKCLREKACHVPLSHEERTCGEGIGI